MGCRPLTSTAGGMGVPERLSFSSHSLGHCSAPPRAAGRHWTASPTPPSPTDPCPRGGIHTEGITGPQGPREWTGEWTAERSLSSALKPVTQPLLSPAAAMTCLLGVLPSLLLRYVMGEQVCPGPWGTIAYPDVRAVPCQPGINQILFEIAVLCFLLLCRLGWEPLGWSWDVLTVLVSGLCH